MTYGEVVMAADDNAAAKDAGLDAGTRAVGVSPTLEVLIGRMVEQAQRDADVALDRAREEADRLLAAAREEAHRIIEAARERANHIAPDPQDPRDHHLPPVFMNEAVHSAGEDAETIAALMSYLDKAGDIHRRITTTVRTAIDLILEGQQPPSDKAAGSVAPPPGSDPGHDGQQHQEHP